MKELKASPRWRPFVAAGFCAGVAIAVALLAAGRAEVRAVSSAASRFITTPLMEAAGQGDAKRARELIQAGADVNAKNQRGGATALFSAALVGSVETVRVLLEAGADVNARADSGFTPLFCAIHSGSNETVRVLLDAGAEVNVKDAETGITPLAAAKVARRGFTLNLGDWLGSFSVEFGSRPDLVKLLKDAGAVE